LSDAIKDKITKAVNTSGFPLELFVANIAKKNNEIPWHNQFYLDQDSDKPRSIDIVVTAFNRSYEIKDNAFFGVDLAIECKKSSEAAWVFFETDEIVLDEYLGQFIGYNQYAIGNYEIENTFWKFGKRFPLHYEKNTEGFTHLATNFQTIRIGENNLDDSRVPKGKDTIFEAVNQVIKYISYKISKAEKNIVPRFYEKGIYPLFNLTYPIIVYDGPMYNGFLKNDKIELEERDNIVLQYYFKPAYAERERTFLIDVVKKEYFETLLHTLKDENKKMRKHLADHSKEFYEDVKTIKIEKERVSKFV